ncbi:15074_t:CDS:2, partial [Gigaspora margarita]
QVNTAEILKKVRDQEKFKKLSNNDQDEIYMLHIIGLFQKKGVSMYSFEAELKKDSPYIFIGKGEINMLDFKKNFKVLLQSKFESVTPTEINKFATLLSSYDDDTIGVFAASSFSKKAINFANMYPRKLFLIVDNLNDLNNFNEVYNDISKYFFYRQSNNYNDSKNIGNIKVSLKNQSFKVSLKNGTFETFNLNVDGNGESLIEINE